MHEYRIGRTQSKLRENVKNMSASRN